MSSNSGFIIQYPLLTTTTTTTTTNDNNNHTTILLLQLLWLAGTTRVSRYQKKHSLTHTHH